MNNNQIINLDYVLPTMRNKLQEYVNISRLIEAPLNYKLYSNAIIVPVSEKHHKCGVLDNCGNFIDGTHIHEGSCTQIFNGPDLKINDEGKDVIFIGTLHYIFGHAITDNLKKIWFLYTQQCKDIIQKGGKVVYLSLTGRPLPNFILRILELAGVDINNITPVDKITRYNNVIVPEDSIKILKGKGRFYYDEYRKTIEVIKKNCLNHSLPKYEKVYFSRTALTKRGRDFGEKRLEKYFQNHGYHIVYPEKITLEEQINIVANCNCFAATESSVSHHAVFCKPNTKMILLQKSNYVNGYTLVVNAVSKVNVYYVTANYTRIKSEPWKGPFYMDVTKQVGALFKETVYNTKWLNVEWYKYLAYKYNILL